MGDRANKRAWRGRAEIVPGVGLFRGHAGDNQSHKHWAHQISIGIDNDVSMIIDNKTISCPGIVITAGVTHQLLHGRVLNLYCDPMSDTLNRLGIVEEDPAYTILSTAACAKIMANFPDSISLQESVAILHSAVSEVNSDSKLANVLATLISGIDAEVDVSRGRLAAAANLSPSRFSHWFSDQTGMPLRSYRKWIRIVIALESAVLSGNLSDAAAKGGFSDQAHFTRAIKAAFGITPKELKSLFR